MKSSKSVTKRTWNHPCCWFMPMKALKMPDHPNIEHAIAGGGAYDYFISYAHTHTDLITSFVQQMKRWDKNLRNLLWQGLHSTGRVMDKADIWHHSGSQEGAGLSFSGLWSINGLLGWISMCQAGWSTTGRPPWFKRSTCTIIQTPCHPSWVSIVTWIAGMEILKSLRLVFQTSPIIETGLKDYY